MSSAISCSNWTEASDDDLHGDTVHFDERVMDDIMSRRLKQRAKARRQVRVQKEIHARTKCWLLNCSDRLANSKQASKSSRSKSGNSANTSSNESPAAKYSRRDSTGYRNPRMTGLPWQISGSIVMRDSSEFISKGD